MDDDPPGEATSEGPCAAVSLRVVAAAAWHVVRGRSFSDFPRVLTFLEKVAEAAPELVPFQHLAKLRLGLKAKIIMNMLQEDQPQEIIYHAMDIYFPENEPPLCHSRATAEDLEMVQVAQENFRILVLKLLSECIQKEIYVQKYLEMDYGEAFMKVVEKLFCDYLYELEQVLPEPQFQMLLEAASMQTPSQLPPPSATILNQYFSAMRYQQACRADLPTSPSQPSFAPRQSEDKDPRTQPFSPHPGGSWDVDSPSCVSEGDSHRQLSETSEDLVPDSERSTSPFQVE
ncbi:TERF1-interacting nuclear factor 2 isoform X2 [Pseudonaja textilis]|uniref:TERF1-interacting nuclear factor 2 isoform X2 n=1 Tax=Pseudonaja textilis TaxID=8673 RepID=UPI000EA8A97B|nr:TERF1-interacting nuclear factor 2 isoform X2 [Pseudonaja textilis]